MINSSIPRYLNGKFMSLFTYSDLMAEYRKICNEESKKYNPVKEYELGQSVHPSFPFQVKLVVGFMYDVPTQNDVRKFDPIPEPWYLKISEDPTKETKLTHTRFDISNLRSVVSADNQKLKFSNLDVARKASLKLSSITMSSTVEYSLDGKISSYGLDFVRKVKCKNCDYTTRWQEQKVIDFEAREHLITLNPLSPYDEIMRLNGECFH